MGNTQATVSSCERAIYQVTSVTRLSPGAECGLQAQDDFLVAINGKELINMSMESMMVIVKNSVNRPVELTVYNSKTKKTRTTTLLPSNDWPGEGLLGIKLKLGCVDCRGSSSQDLNSAVDFKCKYKTDRKSFSLI